MAKKTAVSALALLVLLCTFFAPLSAKAAGGVEYHDIDVVVELQRDGSAVVTEVWDLTANEGTEVYLEQIDLDEQEITSFSVSENGVAFEDVGDWDVNAGMAQKAGKSGIVYRGDGYELCWGLGSYGRHVFTAQYTVTNMVKGYTDADVLYQKFLNDIPQDAGHVKITIRYPGTVFTVQNTGVWGGGTEGDIGIVDGAIVAETTGTFKAGSAINILAQFAEGMFSPGVQRTQSFEEVKMEALEGTDYLPDDYDPDNPPADTGWTGNNAWNSYDGRGSGWSGSSGPFGWFVSWWDESGILIIAVAGAVVAVLFSTFARKVGGAATTGGSGSTGTMKKEYRNAEYSRELPFGGSLPATFARLKDLNQHGNDGNIIGAYLLKWIRSRQVEIITEEVGAFRKKDEDSIKLFAARLDMDPVEWQLYDMLMKAAGEDFVLQSKEFEKWSKKNYTTVQGWLEQYQNSGKQEMRTMGAVTEVEGKAFFGLVTTRKSQMTEKGEKLTVEMFGFKKYLQEFTIINERQAREVQLWDEYLIFAQVFGIAEEVAEQFKQLYPDYFRQVSEQLGYRGMNVYDMIIINRIARNYGRAMSTGMRAGYNAATSGTRFGGGGGGMFTGGGGFGGASGGGSRGVR